MTKEELIILLDKRQKEYLEKSANFNSKTSILICTIDERASLISFAEGVGIRFDIVDCFISEKTVAHWIGLYGNNANYFISNHVMNDEIKTIIVKSKIESQNIYVGPTSTAYFDLYDKRDNIYANADRIAKCLDILADEQSKETLINIAVRLLLPYQFHYEYTVEDFFQYYPHVFKWNDKEVYVDAGVSDGINIFQFIEKVNWKYSSVVAIEADTNNYCLAKNNLSYIKNLDLMNKALFSHECTLRFLSTDKSTKRGNARVQNDGDISVSAISGDSLNIAPTYIKMDIEGAEMAALDGFQKSIVECKPKLAICAYHSQTDFWEIPLKLHEMNPKYKIILRNHEHLETLIETVAYAWEE